MADMFLFGDNTVRLYKLSEVYNPDTDNPVDIIYNRKQVPAVPSLVVDDTLGEARFRVYAVQNVDNEGPDPTYECDMVELFNNTNLTHRMLNYGDNMLLLLFERDGYANSSLETFDRFIVDRRLQFISDSAASYVLVNDADEIISINQTDLEAPPGTGFISMVGTGPEFSFEDCAVIPANNPGNGDVVTMKVYDDDNVQIGEFQLICREASAVGSLTAASKVITDVQLTAPTESWAGDNIILSVDGDPETLDLRLQITYGDGSSTELVVSTSDDIHVYGLEDIVSDVEMAGAVYDIAVKYFLPVGLHSPMEGHNNGSERFIIRIGHIQIGA